MTCFPDVRFSTEPISCRVLKSNKHLVAALEEFRAASNSFPIRRTSTGVAHWGWPIFTIVSAVAQLERDLIRERVSAGIRNARANGKRLGRPKSGVDPERIRQLRARGKSLQQIAANLGVGYGTMRARLLKQLAENPTRIELLKRLIDGT